ncbi:MAG: NAD(P)/FAD-dependent oxidoreductase [Saprospiraceae bacterium]|nr:NAD(P)/FAD-dependent oxidoreductase [Saprospiraceae bacterium]
MNIPTSQLPRIVIVGAGFAGLSLARKLMAKHLFQVVLIDKNNYHQFQPLFYQVAMAGLEPSSISFPLRRVLRSDANVYIRIAEVLSVDPALNMIITDIGSLVYDYLILATGAKTNFFGNTNIEKIALTLKSLSEALLVRNTILDHYESALEEADVEKRQGYVDIVIIGGGPSGVELAGSLAEMKKYILPKEYNELNPKEVDIYLIEANANILASMSKKASQAAEKYLHKMGVVVMKNNRVSNVDTDFVYLQDGSKIMSKNIIWTAGLTGAILPGLSPTSVTKSNRIKVDSYNRMLDSQNVFVIGDIASMGLTEYPNGHPQVAQAAIQQAKNLAYNLNRMHKKEFKWRPFVYKDLGTLATIGRNKAVADFKLFSFSGFWAWVLWLFVHLFQLLGVRNKLFVFLNWVFNYVSYDQALRFIIKPKQSPRDQPK